MQPFVPLVQNPHAQTILGAYWPRRLDTGRYPVVTVRYQTEPGVGVWVYSQQPRLKPRGAVIVVHGLEGSAQSGYMRSMAQSLLEAGFAVHRMNIRGCGGFEADSITLYHAGLTTDLRIVAERVGEAVAKPVFLCGFSLGGNMVLKLSGELGERAGSLLAGVASISPPIDLRACAMALRQPQNRLYERHFVRSMVKRLRRRHKLMPERFAIEGLKGLGSLYEFDDRITAPAFDFRGADHYYATQSAAAFLDKIRVPSLIIHAKDDPMIPFDSFALPAFQCNPALRLLDVDHGGHVGFLARGARRFWVDLAVTEWLSGAHGNVPQDASAAARRQAPPPAC